MAVKWEALMLVIRYLQKNRRVIPDMKYWLYTNVVECMITYASVIGLSRMPPLLTSMQVVKFCLSGNSGSNGKYSNNRTELLYLPPLHIKKSIVVQFKTYLKYVVESDRARGKNFECNIMSIYVTVSYRIIYIFQYFHRQLGDNDIFIPFNGTRNSQPSSKLKRRLNTNIRNITFYQALKNRLITNIMDEY